MADKGNGWEAADIFDVIKRLVADHPGLTDRERTMAEALIDAHGSQYAANSRYFHASLDAHGQALDLPTGSPRHKAALREAGYGSL